LSLEVRTSFATSVALFPNESAFITVTGQLSRSSTVLRRFVNRSANAVPFCLFL